MSPNLLTSKSATELSSSVSSFHGFLHSTTLALLSVIQSETPLHDLLRSSANEDCCCTSCNACNTCFSRASLSFSLCWSCSLPDIVVELQVVSTCCIQSFNFFSPGQKQAKRAMMRRHGKYSQLTVL